jgi:hypothetical protein
VGAAWEEHLCLKLSFSTLADVLTVPEAQIGRDGELLAEVARLRLLLDEAGLNEAGQRHGGTVLTYDPPFFAAFRHTRMPMIATNPVLPDNPIIFANSAFLDLTG